MQLTSPARKAREALPNYEADDASAHPTRNDYYTYPVLNPHSVCPKLLSNFEPRPKPVLLHGDLWSGNVSTNAETGEPVIFDCSAYYGHSEADFGISHMFSSGYLCSRPPQPSHVRKS